MSSFSLSFLLFLNTNRSDHARPVHNSLFRGAPCSWLLNDTELLYVHYLRPYFGAWCLDVAPTVFIKMINFLKGLKGVKQKPSHSLNHWNWESLAKLWQYDLKLWPGEIWIGVLPPPPLPPPFPHRFIYPFPLHPSWHRFYTCTVFSIKVGHEALPIACVTTVPTTF